MKFSQEFDIVFNKKQRRKKAATIVEVLKSQISPKNLNTLNCLEIGCAAGLMSEYFSEYINTLCCIEVDDHALKYCMKIQKNNLKFLQNSAMNLAFKNKSFDIIICNHIYEHVPNADILFEEISRIIKPDGVVYVACTNKYWIIEPHYNLPFLSYLPKSLADIYLKIFTKQNEYNIQLKKYRDILKLFKRFKSRDITLDLIKNAEKYNLKLGILKFVPIFIIKIMYHFIPNYIFILKKGDKK